jgi:hypothetical protein
MRIFVLGVGAVGSYLTKLLTRQGHRVACGDRDPERARYFLGDELPIPVSRVNARDLWSVTKAARGSRLIVNTCPPVVNKVVIRAALRLRVHYLDTASHYTGQPYRAEQLEFQERFRHKRRAAVVTAGAAPGLTNLFIAAAADFLDSIESAKVRLYEATEAAVPLSQWSAEASFDEAVARPRVYVDGRYRFGPRFGEREVFRFPPPIGPVGVVLAAQDEVITVPSVIPLKSMDAKCGGSDIDRLRRWYRQGKLRKSGGPVPSRFMPTPTPRTVHRLLRRGLLHNARFAASVVVEGLEDGHPTTVRWDAMVPSLFQLRRQGLLCSPIAWATAQMAALFVKHFPRDASGVYPPEALPADIRKSILRDAKARGFRITKRIRDRRPSEP